MGMCMLVYLGVTELYGVSVCNENVLDMCV
jgi:hypothetical protein